MGDVWTVWGKMLGDPWKICGRCLEGFSGFFGRLLKGLGKVWGEVVVPHCSLFVFLFTLVGFVKIQSQGFPRTLGFILNFLSWG